MSDLPQQTDHHEDRVTAAVILRCAMSHGIPRRSFWTAVVVGTLLNAINQGDLFIAEGPVNWPKLILTYFVPYCVATYGAVAARLANDPAP